MTLHRIITALTLFSALFLASVDAQAHARLDRADPRVGSQVPKAPSVVTLWFTERLEPAFSGVEVHDASGGRVDTGTATVDRNDPTRMQIGVKALKPGTYKVYWHVMSVDTHKTTGSFTFRVGP
jgi:methionine-rich copper-binding protein CopC